jgi:hypothetical protein
VFMRVERIGLATLYHGWCQDVIPSIDGDYCRVLTDPPYGTGWVRGGGAVGEFTAKHEKPDWDVFSTAWLDLVGPMRMGRIFPIAAFCAPSYLHRMCAAFRTPCIARYKKTNVRPGGNAYEFIVCNDKWASDLWEVEAYNGDNEYHPTQKPIRVMEWAVRWLPSNNGGPMQESPILDPFMGSGTTGVACANLGVPFIGIEQDEGFFNAAIERITNAQRQERLIA